MQNKQSQKIGNHKDFKKMDVVNNGNGNVNKAMVWISHHMNKRYWSGNSTVYTWSLVVLNLFLCENKICSNFLGAPHFVYWPITKQWKPQFC